MLDILANLLSRDDLPKANSDAWSSNRRMVRALLNNNNNGDLPKLIASAAKSGNAGRTEARAVIWAENARGGYGGWGSKFDDWGWSSTIMPMNVNKNKWAGIIDKKPKDMHNAKDNIEAGVVLLKRIEERIQNPTPSKIGSIWVFSGSEEVSNYGSYIGRIYKEKPWLPAKISEKK